MKDVTPRRPADVLLEFLDGAFDPERLADVVTRLVAEDAIYVSLNFDDPELARLMPWAGTKRGQEAFVENFRGVRTRWTVDAFQITDTLTDGDRVAVFGTFTLRSVTLDQAATSPFVVFARIADDRITFFQYMEDTFATARTFLRGGSWTIDADPAAGAPIQV
jgi:ketosteroid isomerase-like protein